jgi:hypothetical protein
MRHVGATDASRALGLLHQLARRRGGILLLLGRREAGEDHREAAASQHLPRTRPTDTNARPN